MAKDVDLSSREWIDLVFEGKNKEFGAYTMRAENTKRHNKAVIYSLIGMVVVALLTWAIVGVQNYIEEQRLKDKANQEQVVLDLNTGEEEEEQQPQKIEEEKKEILKEEVQQSAKVTEIAVVEDKLVKEENKVKEKEKIMDEEKAFGVKDNDKGSDDREKPTMKKDEVVVEKKQEKPAEVKEVKEEKKEEKKETNEIFKSVEQSPQFPGGEAALLKYVSSHINYPAAAQENNVQGRTVLQFVVEKNGKVGEVKVVKSAGDASLDREAIRVVKTLPAFTPGRQNGQPVRVWYTLPVTFKLQNAN